MNKNMIVSMFIYSNISPTQQNQIADDLNVTELKLLSQVRAEHLLMNTTGSKFTTVPPEVIEYIKDNL